MLSFQMTRRSLFKRAAFAAAAMGVPSWSLAKLLNAEEPPVLGLAAGTLGRFVRPALAVLPLREALPTETVASLPGRVSIT